MKNLAIIEQLGEPDFFQLAKEQLMRDFSKVGIEFELSADIQQSESLAKALINELDAILEQRPDLFAHLLYIMDLSETKVKEIIQTSDYTARDLALPMIHRAAEKVYWRKRYSTH